MLKRLLMAAAVIVWSAGTSSAAPVFFFGEDTSTAGSGLGPNSQAARDLFLSNLVGVGNEDFEGFTVGDTAPLALSFPGSSGTLGATLSGTDCVDDTSSAGCGGSNPGRFPTSGSQFWETDSGGGFSVVFNDPINAFGFNATDVGDFGNQLVITLTDINDVATPYLVNHSLNLDNLANSTLFWGFIDDMVGYKSATFSNTGQGGDVFAFDDMVVGDLEQITTPVPEPSSLILLGTGLLGAGWLAARRRRQP